MHLYIRFLDIKFIAFTISELLLIPVDKIILYLFNLIFFSKKEFVISPDGIFK